MSAWTYVTYRWSDEAAWLAARAAQDWAEQGWGDGTPPGVNLLVVGRLYEPQEPSSETNEAPPPEPLPGWHVAAAFREAVAPTEWAAQRIVTPPGMAVLGRTPTPQSVTRFQARAALAMAGLLDGVEAAVAASPNLLARLAWADAQSFERQSPTIASLAAILGLSTDQIDELFQTAAEIVA